MMNRQGELEEQTARAQRRARRRTHSAIARDIIVIGCSAGGMEAITGLFKALPSEVPAAVFVVMHVSSHADSVLPRVLGRIGPLPAQHAVEDAPIRHGRVYVAPPGFHLLLERSRMHLSRGPKENRHRPAIDPLFRTAAAHHGERVVAIVLSGSLDDGSMGLKEVKTKNGLTIVQDPSEALFPHMPANAMAAVHPDFCLPVAKIGSLLPTLIKQSAAEEAVRRNSKDKGMKPESKAIKSAKEVGEKMGSPSMFVCPECNGPLWEVKDGESSLYRCLVGHAYAPENLFAAQSEEVERALWVALRSLEERVELHRQMAERSKNLHQSLSAKQFLNKAQENARHAKVIRNMLEKL